MVINLDLRRLKSIRMERLVCETGVLVCDVGEDGRLDSTLHLVQEVVKWTFFITKLYLMKLVYFVFSVLIVLKSGL